MTDAAEHIERLEAMAEDNGQTWDLSDNDRAAIRFALAEVERLRADAARWDWAQANLSSLTWEDNGYSAREYVDYLAGSEATWLPK